MAVEMQSNMPGSGWMACTLTVCTASVCDHTHHYKIHDSSGVTMATKAIFYGVLGDIFEFSVKKLPRRKIRTMWLALAVKGVRF